VPLIRLDRELPADGLDAVAHVAQSASVNAVGREAGSVVADLEVKPSRSLTELDPDPRGAVGVLDTRASGRPRSVSTGG
jgi:hypothetical protein